MKYLLIVFLLVGCIGKLSYHYPNPGTCIKLEGSDYADFVIKNLKGRYFLVLQFDYYSSEKSLYGLGQGDFLEDLYEFVECPKFKTISVDSENELKNRKEYKEFLLLMKDNHRRKK